MDLDVDVHLPFLPEVVFGACRDEIVELKRYLRGIRSVEVIRRTEHGAVVENAVEWHAGAGMPAPVRAVLGERFFSWTDYATWDAEALSCAWRSESTVFDGAIHCAARDEFLRDEAGHTLLRLRGFISVDARRLRRLAGPFAIRMSVLLERYVVRKIQSDFVNTVAALTKYLEESG